METSDRILDTAEALIIERGFSGFSFQDLADAVGIRKASIYYHFPAKADLGCAVVARYRKRMSQAFEQLNEPNIDRTELLKRYVTPMMVMGRTDGQACLSGVLGGEYIALPSELQRQIKEFFVEHEAFLAALLESGRNDGTFQFQGSARDNARLIISAIEGALLIKRILGDAGYFETILSTMLAQLQSGRS
jgi:TetR/AcrR family transcriptional regulator, transcriptional repressor for nem operon